MQNATLKGDYASARRINDRLSQLHKALFCEPSPAPIKYACSLLGICTEEVRLPLLPLTDAGKEKVRAAMTHAGLI
jgi:4-hydroxy-tetrahydrodipicolinate synthase